MVLSNPIVTGLYSGLVATLIGVVAFSLSWNLWGFFEGPLPGYQVFLFPGNLTLIYFWHPLFTEEVNFWPKLLMLLLGQFVVITGAVTLLVSIKQQLYIQARSQHYKNKK